MQSVSERDEAARFPRSLCVLCLRTFSSPTRRLWGTPPHPRHDEPPLMSYALRFPEGEGTRDAEVPACAGRRGPHPHPNLLPSREKGPDRLRERWGGWRSARSATCTPHPMPSLRWHDGAYTAAGTSAEPYFEATTGVAERLSFRGDDEGGCAPPAFAHPTPSPLKPYFEKGGGGA